MHPEHENTFKDTAGSVAFTLNVDNQGGIEFADHNYEDFTYLTKEEALRLADYIQLLYGVM